MTNKRLKILIIAPAPENIGGISTHIRRLMDLLSDEMDFDIIDEGRKRWHNRFNLRSLNIPRYVKKAMSADVVSIQSGAFIFRIFNILICRYILRKPTIVTIHRDPTIEKHISFTKRLLSNCDLCITVNKNGFDLLKTDNNRCRYKLLPAFIPPCIEKEPPIPDEINHIITDIKKTEGALAVSNAWRLARHNGEDLYGLDMCIDAMIELKDRMPNLHLIFVIADPTDSEPYLTSYLEKARNAGIEHRITIYKRPLSFVRLIMLSDMVLRPTNTDGDAISIREALHFGKQVVASDVVERPTGTIIHATRNVKSFADAIEYAAAATNHMPDDNQDYKSIYRSLFLSVAKNNHSLKQS